MLVQQPDSPVSSEEFLARLTTAAYEVALHHGLKGPFIDVELALWRRLEAVLRVEPPRVKDISA